MREHRPAKWTSKFTSLSDLETIHVWLVALSTSSKTTLTHSTFVRPTCGQQSRHEKTRSEPTNAFTDRQASNIRTLTWFVSQTPSTVSDHAVSFFGQQLASRHPAVT